MTERLHRLLPLLLVLLAPMATAEPDEGVDDTEPTRCINTGSILKTKVIDDGNVVFMMRRDKMYLNTLRSRCRGLARYGRFAYTLQTRSLCELERITIIEEGTVGRPKGRSCTLGMFQPVTMDDLAIRFAPVIRQRQQEQAGADIEEIAEESVDAAAEESAEQTAPDAQ
jgi:hypothetical protein